MFVHLHVHSEYSLLDGGSTIEDLVRRNAEIGMPALAITDHNSLTAAIKFNTLCKSYGISPIFGTELTLGDGSHLTLLAKSRVGYANICSLLSMAYAVGGRLSPALPWDCLPGLTEGIVCLSGCRNGKVAQLVLAHRYDDALTTARQLKGWFPDLYIELQNDLTPQSYRLCRDLSHLARHLGVGVVATNNVHYATPDGMIAHDIKTCIRNCISVADIHPDRPFNTERYLKTPREMVDLFEWLPEAIDNTMFIMAKCSHPGILPMEEEIVPFYQTDAGETPGQHLRSLVYAGACRRRGRLTARVTARIEEELYLIDKLGHSSFVLHAARIVRWARSEGIFVTGRGSGADSEVCYDLGLTDIDVIERNLPVERWIAPGKIPDIDIDFEDRRRDDVFRWCAVTYGADKVALCCTYATYWSKSALRDVGKVLGLPDDVRRWFVENVSSFGRADEIEASFLDCSEMRSHRHMTERFTLLFKLCAQISGHPRHVGSHSSGLVLSGVPLATVNVVTPSARGILPILMLDKDDVEDAGAVKLDILSLPILSVTQDATHDIRRSNPSFTYEGIPREDEDTYRMLWTGSNIGLFQLGSPAQAALAMSLRPSDFEHLVASVGLIRPGPIKAQAVKQYVSAKNGYARIEYLHPSLKRILERTLGVCCFQEQVAYIIAAMFGVSTAEADRWRKSLTKHHRNGTLPEAGAEFVKRAMTRHSDLSFDNAKLIAESVLSWHGLGFVEGHSASFALTGQKTAYMLRHYPAEYYGALLSNQPCGFYPVQTIASEARRRGVQVQGIDILASDLPCTTDASEHTLRLGLCLVQHMRESDIAAILKARDEKPFASLLDFCVRVPLPRNSLENLVLAGAFDTLHEHRRGMMWRLDETIDKANRIKADTIDCPQRRLDLAYYGQTETPIAWDINDLSPWEKMLWEWRVTGITSDCHPFAYLRPALAAKGIISAQEAMLCKGDTRVTVAGLNIRPHRPPSKSGGRHLFCSIEDESALLQCAFYGNDIIEDCMATVLLSPVVVVRGRVKRTGLGASLEVSTAWPMNIRDMMPDDGYTRVAELDERRKARTR